MNRAIFPMLVLFFPVAALSFESPLGNLGGDAPPKTVLSYAGAFASDGSVRSEKAAAQLPLWKTEESSVSVGVRNHQFSLSRDLVLPDSGVAVPKSLKSTELNIAYASKMAADETVGGRIGFGSASDRTFHGSRTSSVGGTVFWAFPARTDPSGRWILSLNYSNNNSFTTLPIPGFAYLYTASGWTGIFGLPFAYVRWTPEEGGSWTLSGFYLLTTLKLEAAYGPPFMNGFVRLEWGQESWMRADRDRVDDRLTFDEKKALIGGRMPLARGLFLEGEAGYAFDRSFYEGKSRFEKTSGLALLADSSFAALSLRALF